MDFSLQLSSFVPRTQLLLNTSTATSISLLTTPKPLAPSVWTTVTALFPSHYVLDIAARGVMWKLKSPGKGLSGDEGCLLMPKSSVILGQDWKNGG